jgi:precorrin-6B methylase 2
MYRHLIPASILLSLALFVSLPGTARSDEDESAGTPDVVYVATPHDVVAKMLSMARVTKDDVVYDLGCGDGRIVVAAAKQFGCRGVGFDLNPVRISESRVNAKKNGVEDLVRFERRDVFTVDLSKATVITLYLLPEMNERLVPQLQKLAPGSRIVAHDYAIEGYPADKEITMTSKQDAVEHYLYLWTTPLEKEEDQ